MAFQEILPHQAKRPFRDVRKFFIHCTATDAEGKAYEGVELAKTIDRWHKQRGWSGIGYHFVIDKEGRLSTGRDIERTPAAQARHNARTLTVSLHGLEEDKFTEAQFKTLIKLCERYDYLYSGRITFHGHCEVSAKSCPVFDYKKVLNLNEIGLLGV